MAIIRTYTTIEQSKKLAEILPIESADMYWFRQIDSDYFPPDVESIYPIPLYKDGKEDFEYDVPCWSLAALFDVLPNTSILLKGFDKIYDLTNGSGEFARANNPIDACYELILKLNELKLL